MDKSERLSILDKLAAGQIGAAEAMRLLDEKPAPAEPIAALKSQEAAALDDVIKIESLDEPPALKKAEAQGEVYVPDNGDKPRWLKVRVRDMNKERDRVTITLPLGLVSLGLGLARRFGADSDDIDIDQVLAMIKSGERGILVDVLDEEDNEHVQIYLD